MVTRHSFAVPRSLHTSAAALAKAKGKKGGADEGPVEVVRTFLMINCGCIYFFLSMVSHYSNPERIFKRWSSFVSKLQTGGWYVSHKVHPRTYSVLTRGNSFVFSHHLISAAPLLTCLETRRCRGLTKTTSTSYMHPSTLVENVPFRKQTFKHVLTSCRKWFFSAIVDCFQFMGALTEGRYVNGCRIFAASI